MNINDSYTDGFEFVMAGRNGFDRPIANNTRLVVDKTEDNEPFIGIKFHDTYVVKNFKNGDMEFDSGGWRTMSTKDRMSFQSTFSVYSDAGVWKIYHREAHDRAEKRLREKMGLPTDERYLGFVGGRSRGYGYFGDELVEQVGRKEAVRIFREYTDQLKRDSVYLFEDGIRFTKRGRCINGQTVRKAEAKIKRDEALRERIRRYAVVAAVAIDVRRPAHNPEDCFECNVGFPESDHQHLLSHMAESYVPTALIQEAMSESSYSESGQDMMLGWHMEDQIAYIGGLRGSRRRAHPEAVAKAVYEYMMKRLLPNRPAKGNFGNALGTPIPEISEKAFLAVA